MDCAELHLKQQSRQLLKHVRGLSLVEDEGSDVLLPGFGGTFAVKFPMISTAMGEVRCCVSLETDVDFLVSNDSSCLMHLQGLLSRKKENAKPFTSRRSWPAFRTHFRANVRRESGKV